MDVYPNNNIKFTATLARGKLTVIFEPYNGLGWQFQEWMSDSFYYMKIKGKSLNGQSIPLPADEIIFQLRTNDTPESPVIDIQDREDFLLSTNTGNTLVFTIGFLKPSISEVTVLIPALSLIRNEKVERKLKKRPRKDNNNNNEQPNYRNGFRGSQVETHEAGGLMQNLNCMIRSQGHLSNNQDVVEWYPCHSKASEIPQPGDVVAIMSNNKITSVILPEEAMEHHLSPIHYGVISTEPGLEAQNHPIADGIAPIKIRGRSKVGDSLFVSDPPSRYAVTSCSPHIDHQVLGQLYEGARPRASNGQCYKGKALVSFKNRTLVYNPWSWLVFGILLAFLMGHAFTTYRQTGQ